MKVVGGGQPDSNILGKHKKERSSNTGIMKIVIREKGGGLNFLFLLFFLIFSSISYVLIKEVCVGRGNPTVIQFK